MSIRRGLKAAGVRVSLRLGLALLVLAPLASSFGCGAREATPDEVARRFVAAVRSRNSAAVIAQVDAATRKRLDQMAELATDRVGGRRVIEPVELLHVVEVDPTFDVDSAEVIERSETAARVKLTAPDGEIEVVELVHEDEGWRVRLPPLAELESSGVADPFAPEDSEATP